MAPPMDLNGWKPRIFMSSARCPKSLGHLTRIESLMSLISDAEEQHFKISGENTSHFQIVTGPGGYAGRVTLNVIVNEE